MPARGGQEKDSQRACNLALPARIVRNERCEPPVEVVTGGPASYNRDRLEVGVLEASADDTLWTKLADFAEGKASANAPAGTRQLRVRVTAAQGFYLIIHEISVGKK